MASDILGVNFDVHSGGEDLKFPHHDNELAQAEAQSGERQWVNYFWHAGHLNIQGLKMSKSLKNFISIGEVLKRNSGRQIRILFLLQGWDAKMNYSDASLDEAANVEGRLREFFINVRTAMRNAGPIGLVHQMWFEPERKLNADLEAAQEAVHAGLCDNFNYPVAMQALLALVQAFNKYLAEVNSQKKAVKNFLVQRVAQYVDSILRMFGVMGEKDFGFSTGGDGADKAVESSRDKIIDALAAFREKVRKAGQEGKDNQHILELCDLVRDDVLPELGVRLEDKGEEGTVWKLDDPDVLIKARDEKKAQAKANALKKVVNREAVVSKDIKKFESSALSPKAFFAAQDTQYSQFDAEGKPIADAEGKPLSKSAIKAMEKAYAKQAKDHEAYTARVEKDGADFLDKMQEEVAALQAQIKALNL